MLSILIPIYNQHVGALIESLTVQCSQLEIAYEIICIDDYSEEKVRAGNEAVLSHQQNVYYHQLDQNIGRARIRNLLASKAKFQNLLFLDCDSTIVDDHFIKKYLHFVHPRLKQVCVGGTCYSESRPEDPDYHLHWLHGRKKESLPADKRNQRPHEYLHTNNFMAHKSILERLVFDETIRAYGYEDLEWSARLLENKIKVIHIDNAVRHDGLKSEKDFIRDIGEASRQLAVLYQQKKISKTRLIRYYKFLRSTCLIKPLRMLYFALIKNPGQGPFRLLSMDLYKMFCFDQSISDRT